MGKHSQYGVILDAGSSGTRVYVYKWKNPARASAKASSEEELRSLPEIKLKDSKKVHPGVSSFAERPSAIGKDHLKELLEVAYNKIPADKIPETPVFLLATAGVRLLPDFQQRTLLGNICQWLQKNTRFDLPDCSTHVQVIKGETEGLYGWIAANYLLGGFNHPQGEGIGLGQSHHHTYGFLDMGGASAQIAFAPNSTEAEKHADDLKLVRMRHLDGSPAEYRVFTTTWLGFGANQARERFVKNLRAQYSPETNEIPDPCMPHGLVTNMQGDPIAGQPTEGEQVLVGIGQFDECLRLTYPLLEMDAPCDDKPCLINGKHVPALDFKVNRFVGVSEYWHTTHGVFGGKDTPYDLEAYQNSVLDYCSRDWSDIERDDLEKRKKSPERKAEDAREACFKASWLINMLYDGIGIPRVGLEAPILNSTDMDGSFQPVDTIDGVELSWTLGKIVLYAAGQVPSIGEPLPVGFGTNVATGTPIDFEHAGSIPQMPFTGGLDDEIEDEDINTDEPVYRPPPPSHKPTPKRKVNLAPIIFGAIFLIIIIFFVLRRPERRRRLWNLARRRSRSSSGRKPKGSGGRALTLANKIFGRSHHQYERVMEEGEAATNMELGGAEVDEFDASDSSEGSKGQKSALASSKQDESNCNSELRPPNALDRRGLAVRTESRERMGAIGRRSRAASPQRQKSPLASPMDRD
ncbi:Golgi nucleoside diphosphatase [Emericellopsis cladophorae]|uniref:Golgi nucleoside diphosphatase n=1 Tax=Emericellopsis cladophorae TaxID=2686198 RepID=A0A9Q0BER3_9HYPO|nr:Golgi nucleoside diphosphatase [Emericellopsis cladophorae]KAI6782707.1 Golgi nucleoside diphosphatase [Emericellopsis cladophorae]